MSSSKVTDTATVTEQVPSILNNNYVKIGGGVFIFIIFVIILYFNFPSSPSPEKIVKVPQYNKCELFPRCNFIKKSFDKEEKDNLINKYPSLNISNDTLIFDSINIINSRNIPLSDTIIRSIRSEGYDITLYPLPNFTGTPIKKTGNINIECFEGEVPMRSAIINIMPGIDLTGLIKN
jgi:hypothetical protein